MDNQMLVSMIGSTSSAQETKSTKKTETNSSAFSQALDEATSSKNAGGEQSEELIAEKRTPKSDAEQRKAEEQDAQAQAKANQAKLQDPKNASSRAYLYQMMYKNPDTMSMAEKQSLKLDPKTGLNMNDLQSLMQERGLNMRDLTFAQMSELTKSTSKAEVKEFLDKLAKETGSDKTEGKEATSKAAADAGSTAASAKGEAKSSDSSFLEAVRQTSQAQQTQQAAKTQRRQEVINQIVTHMELRNLASKDELSLKLNPEYLGELKIKITHNDKGEVSAQFLTTSDETLEVLNESRSELRQKVESKGINLNRIEVDLVDELA